MWVGGGGVGVERGSGERMGRVGGKVRGVEVGYGEVGERGGGGVGGCAKSAE